MKKIALVLALPLVLLLVALVGIAVLAAPAPTNLGVDCTPGAPASVTVTGNVPDHVGEYDRAALTRAAAIIAEGKRQGIPPQGQMIALMTAMQESTLGMNASTRTPDKNHDAGLFQQRILPGWYGTIQEVNDPTTAARIFYEGRTATTAGGYGSAGGGKGFGHIPGLKDIRGWQSMAPTEAAQAVQGSAYPDAYAPHQKDALAVIQALTGVSVVPSGAVDNSLGCGTPTAAAPTGLPTQAQLMAPSAQIACPAGTTDLGPADGGVNGKHVPIRLCSIPGTVCTGETCAKGGLGGKARGEAIVNSLVAPHFLKWIAAVRKDGYNPTFNSAFRTWDKQVELWAGGSNGNAARPGYSNHQMATALDISGLPGSYNRNNCAGHMPDGACMASSPAWKSYYTRGTQNGALFHSEEFWHIEWIISHSNERTIPWLK